MGLFEQTGRFFFEKNRAWLFFCLVGAPFCVLLSILIPRFVQLRETERTLDGAALRGRLALEKRAEKDRFLKQYSNCEPYFIDKNLEALPLLQENLDHLIAQNNHPACRSRDEVLKRISFLQSRENHLAFAEENVKSTKHIKEIEERLLHPVEVETKDLDRLLSIIEDVPIGANTPQSGAPQLLIQNFVLSKKAGGTYELNLTLIKREFSQAP